MTEAELLFTEILNCNRAELYLNNNVILDKPKQSLVASVLKRRVSGEPLQYILGKTEFMGWEFKLTQDVFIPRPETEILVETAIKYVASRQSPVASLKIMDIGTGSGCIAVSLAKILAHAAITAIDISQKAINIAKQNALLNNVNIDFLVTDLFSNYKLTAKSYDLIISNPPYIPSMEIEKLQPEISYEPRMALDGGEDGLNFYRKLIVQAPFYLKEGGFLIIEIGFNQKDRIENIFQKSKNFEIIEVIEDYNNIDRIIVAKKSVVT